MREVAPYIFTVMFFTYNGTSFSEGRTTGKERPPSNGTYKVVQI